MLRTSSGSSPGVSRIAVLPLHAGVRGDRAEAGQADEPLADVPVPVLVAAQRNLGVVEVEHHDAVEADLALDQVEEPVDAGGRIDVVAGRPRVRGVEAHRELRMADRADQRAEFFDRAAAELARAGRVLHHEIHAGRDIGERRFERRDDLREAFVAVAFAVRAQVRVDERHRRPRPQRADRWSASATSRSRSSDLRSRG